MEGTHGVRILSMDYQFHPITICLTVPKRNGGTEAILRHPPLQDYAVG